MDPGISHIDHCDNIECVGLTQKNVSTGFHIYLKTQSFLQNENNSIIDKKSINYKNFINSDIKKDEDLNSQVDSNEIKDNYIKDDNLIDEDKITNNYKKINILKSDRSNENLDNPENLTKFSIDNILGRKSSDTSPRRIEEYQDNKTKKYFRDFETSVNTYQQEDITSPVPASSFSGKHFL